MKPKAVALNTGAKDLLMADDSRDASGSQAKDETVAGVADALGQLLAKRLEPGARRGDYQYLTDTKDRLHALVRDSDQAITEMVRMAPSTAYQIIGARLDGVSARLNRTPTPSSMTPAATLCPWPGCGLALEPARGGVRCPRPGHYVRVAMSGVRMGDTLRDPATDLAWGKLTGGRHNHSNASFGGRV